jgi:hypothetical protein
MQTNHFPVATVFIIILNAVIFATGLLSGEQTQIIQNSIFAICVAKLLIVSIY